jgi:hypothetical protein
MIHKFLTLTLLPSFLLIGCKSEKVTTPETQLKSSERQAAQSPAEPSKFLAENVPQTPEATQRVMDQINQQASSATREADQKRVTQKIIDDATVGAPDATKRAMEEAAQNALEAAEQFNGAAPR